MTGLLALGMARLNAIHPDRLPTLQRLGKPVKAMATDLGIRYGLPPNIAHRR